MNKILKFILLIFVVALILSCMFIGYQLIQNKNEEIDELKNEIQAQTNVDLEKEILNKQLKSAQNLVENINNNVSLTILRTSGKLNLFHDKTPKNNRFSEWLINSDINIYANYTTSFSIETEAIQTDILDNATVNILYNTDNITLSSVDITEFATRQNKSILGKQYTPEQVAALEKITREKIVKLNDTPNNKLNAKNNLDNYLKKLSEKFDTKINIVIE